MSFLRLPRPSFRQLLVVAFLLVAILVAAGPLRGLFELERLMNESRRSTSREIDLNVTVQVLTERSIAMERAARQFLVLNDPVLRDRFNGAAQDALAALKRMAAEELAPNDMRAWQAQLANIRTMLDSSRRTGRAGEQQVIAAFRTLEGINDAMSRQARRAAQDNNRALLKELDEGRVEVGRQLAVAIATALVLAVGFGVWLSQPLKQVEAAIVDLGENRLDRPIEIRGPNDVRLLGRRLDWLRVRLAELDSDKARFLRQVSHELKTPLAALREGVALMEDGVVGGLNEKQGNVIRILRENTALLQGQIEDLLRFNAAAFEASRLVRQPCELGELMQSVIAQQSLQVEAKALRIDLDGAPLVADVDREKMGTALSNLLSNAIRYSPPGGHVAVTFSDHDGSARIVVADSGAGVAEVDRARIFEPFFRGERQPADGIRGSGIGLSIVHEIVVAHGGSVTLQPSPDNAPGAHFMIDLPHAIPS